MIIPIHSFRVVLDISSPTQRRKETHLPNVVMGIGLAYLESQDRLALFLCAKKVARDTPLKTLNKTKGEYHFKY